MMPRLLPFALVILGAACAPSGPAATVLPTPEEVVRDSVSGPDAPGARWYGYEGGLKDAEASARSIEGASQYWEERTGKWQDDGLAGSFTGNDDGNWIRRLMVTVDSGPRRGTATFIYDERGRLYYFGGEWRERTGSGRNARTNRVEASVALNRAGEVGAARKSVNGRTQSLTPDDVAWILKVERAARTTAGNFRGRRPR